MHTAKQPVPGPSCLQDEIAIAKLIKCNFPGSDQIPAKLIKPGVETLSIIHKLINFIWNKDELPDQWKVFIILPIHKKGYKTDCNNYPGV
jgi:hypothetical protein